MKTIILLCILYLIIKIISAPPVKQIHAGRLQDRRHAQKLEADALRYKYKALEDRRRHEYRIEQDKIRYEYQLKRDILKHTMKLEELQQKNETQVYISTEEYNHRLFLNEQYQEQSKALEELIKAETTGAATVPKLQKQKTQLDEKIFRNELAIMKLYPKVDKSKI